MTDWKDPRGNLAKYQRQHNAGEINYNEMVDRQSAELDWIQRRCPHKNRDPDNATVWCDDCGADLGPSASTGGSGVVVVKGGCVVVTVALTGTTAALAWSVMETASAIF